MEYIPLITNIGKAAGTAKSWVIQDPTQAATFGVGKPADERTCEQITLFLQTVGRSGKERRRVVLPPDVPIGRVREFYGRNFDQDTIYDEHDYEIIQTDLPISHFSNKCQLNLSFVYSESMLNKINPANLFGKKQ